jgi:DNA-binding NarL/FixJ family response regulator
MTMLLERPLQRKTKLSPTEREVCEYLLCGFSNEYIAQEIGTTAQTVKNYMRDLLDMAGMDDRVQLALWLHENRERLGIKCPCEFGYCEGGLLVNA